MPPKKGIVRSGNAGNSSKASKQTPPATPAPGGEEKKPLFPPGSKTPLSLLYERCQKNGWEKPTIEPRQNKQGFTCVVTLHKFNKKTSSTESVRMEPHPPLCMPTKEEAKHWGATYALYRFANHIQLHLVLPSEPKKYWMELAAEHKNAPGHLAWQYNADPFTARKEVDERQKKAAEIRKKHEEDVESSGAENAGFSRRDVQIASREFEKAPEVMMAGSLRDSVESTIKRMIQLYPDESVGGDSTPTTGIDTTSLRANLQALAFSSHLINKAIGFLTSPPPHSAYLTALLSMPPLDAALAHLLATNNETDLPKRFMSGTDKSMEGFIGSLHSADQKQDLAARWIQERAIKEAGWPEKAVREYMSTTSDGKDWALLNESLGRKLVGLDGLEVNQVSANRDFHEEERDMKRQDEIDALQSVYSDASYSNQSHTVTVPLADAPLTVNFILPPNHPYPSPVSDLKNIRAPPIFITSAHVAPYQRLHLLSRLLRSLYGKDGENSLQQVMESGEGIMFSCIELLEQFWEEVEKKGPPDIAEIMAHLLPASPPEVTPMSRPMPSKAVKGRKRERKMAIDDRSNTQVLDDFIAMQKDSKYADMVAQRSKLPAWDTQDNIVKLVDRSRVVIVVGETGCGKTTQLPQFVLDSLIKDGRGKEANIIVTQPRRVSALGVSARVSAERMEDGSVGYAIRGERKSTSRTKLLFATTGVALRRLATEEGRALAGVTHVIVDEVHERSVDGDFLLLELRELLKRNETIKVILMSATINQQTFVDYFGGAPVVEIPGFTHPVKDLYLEDIMPAVSYRPASTKPSGKQSESQLREFRQLYESMGLESGVIKALEILTRNDRIDIELIVAVVTHIITSSRDARAAVLIFMSGVQEIRHTIDALNSAPSIRTQIEVLPLHANLTSEEQKRVFLPTKRRKVVVATNVAETSITIPDVVYVIDTGKVKEINYDPSVGLSKLAETWITSAAARQRRGRAGRTQPGECYKLFTKRQQDNMNPFPKPEILRVPLDSVTLQVKVMREDEDAKLFLGRAIDPPDISAMERSWKSLEDLGAVDEQGNLTSLGRHMALLPLDLKLSKMLILGTVFRCVGPVLSIVACLSSKPLFSGPMERREEMSQARKRFSTSNSDLLTDINAYNQCMQQRVDAGNVGLRKFCEENFISQATVRDISSLRHEYFDALASIGFVPTSSTPDTPNLNANSSNDNLLKSIILGGLWPHVAVVSMPKAVFDKVQAGTIQRDHESREYKIYEKASGRVFIHPQSMMFDKVGTQKSPFLTYFLKNMTTKIFLKDVTEVPLYGILLFGGKVTVNHVGGGLTVGSEGSTILKMKSWPRIGVLVNQLRRLLDAQLATSFEDATMLDLGDYNDVITTMLSLLANDGLSG